MHEKPGQVRTGLWLALAAAIVSGVAVFVNAYGVRAVPDATVYTTAKNLVAATVLIGLFVANRPARPTPVRLTPGRLAGLAAVAVVGGSVPFVLFFEGLARASSTQSAFIQKTLVVWVALLAVPLLGERLGPLHVAAIGTLVAGQAVLVGGVDRLRFGTGEWLVAAATLLWAVEVVLARRLLRDVPADVLAVARMGGGVVLLLGWVAVSGRWSALAGLTASGWAWAGLTGVILAGYVALWFAALAAAPAVDVTAVLVLAAVITGGLNIAVKGVATNALTGVGLATVLVGTALAIVAARRRAPVRAARVRVPGPLLFARYAYPPNALGYCGPYDAQALIGHTTAGESGPDLAALARQFAGAWPYLQLIAASAGRADPLDGAVVEAYWLGNHLLRTVDPAVFAAHLVDRFEARAGRGLTDLTTLAHFGAVAHHNFHVFAVYPWVGMLRAGPTSEPLRVLDACRVRWGRVCAVAAGIVEVSSQPLLWNGAELLPRPAPGRTRALRNRSGSPGADRATRRHGEHALGLGLRRAHTSAGGPPAGGHRAHPPHDQRGSLPPGRRGRPGLNAWSPSRLGRRGSAPDRPRTAHSHRAPVPARDGRSSNQTGVVSLHRGRWWGLGCSPRVPVVGVRALSVRPARSVPYDNHGIGPRRAVGSEGPRARDLKSLSAGAQQVEDPGQLVQVDLAAGEALANRLLGRERRQFRVRRHAGRVAEPTGVRARVAARQCCGAARRRPRPHRRPVQHEQPACPRTRDSARHRSTSPAPASKPSPTDTHSIGRPSRSPPSVGAVDPPCVRAGGPARADEPHYRPSGRKTLPRPNETETRDPLARGRPSPRAQELVVPGRRWTRGSAQPCRGERVGRCWSYAKPAGRRPASATGGRAIHCGQGSGRGGGPRTGAVAPLRGHPSSRPRLSRPLPFVIGVTTRC